MAIFRNHLDVLRTSSAPIIYKAGMNICHRRRNCNEGNDASQYLARILVTPSCHMYERDEFKGRNAEWRAPSVLVVRWRFITSGRPRISVLTSRANTSHSCIICAGSSRFEAACAGDKVNFSSRSMGKRLRCRPGRSQRNGNTVQLHGMARAPQQAKHRGRSSAASIPRSSRLVQCLEKARDLRGLIE